MKRVGARAVLLWMLGLLLGAGTPAYAQVDFTGVWNANTNAEETIGRIKSGKGAIIVEHIERPTAN